MTDTTPDNSQAPALVAQCRMGMVPVLSMTCPHCGHEQHSNDARLIRHYSTGQRTASTCRHCRGGVYIEKPRVVLAR